MLHKGLRVKALVGLTALGIAMPAFAIMSVPYGWYLEANAGSSRLSNVSYPGNASSSGIGGNANLGYKFMPYFAMEIGYTQYHNTTITDPTSGNKAANVKHYSYDLAGRGILPIVDSGFELFAKLGVERLAARTTINNTLAANNLGIVSSSHSSTGLYYGIGGQYYVMPELAINVQWQRAQGNSKTGNLDLFSGGLSFLFD